MNAKTRIRIPWLGQLSTILSVASLLLLVSVGCSPVNTQQSGPPAPSDVEPQAAPTTPLPTATPEALIPAGWMTYTSQQCEYTISYPSEMRFTDQNTYSRTLGFRLTNLDDGARNFVYVSVIDRDIQSMVKEGVYNNDVYNYDPVEADFLLNMQVGESKSLHEELNAGQSFTYQRLPDTIISSHTAQTYENVQPWEFPVGTKEIRYYLSLDGCIYLIGGYIDTTGSNQAGAITEELFHQIVANVRLVP